MIRWVILVVIIWAVVVGVLLHGVNRHLNRINEKINLVIPESTAPRMEYCSGQGLEWTPNGCVERKKEEKAQ